MGYWKKKRWGGEYSSSSWVEPRDNKCQFVNEYVIKGNTDKIRVPSLKRGSAWKHFYKMFPGLKGKKVIHGHSGCRGIKGGLNESTIKLKKI